jgi:RNA polymerase sigma-70 factor (ECF subfamily)
MSDLYINYYPIIKKTVFGIIKDSNAVEDVINDSFVKLIEKVSTLQGLKCYQLTSYIVYTSRNTALNFVKRRGAELNRTFYGAEEDVAETLASASYTPELAYFSKERGEMLGKALEQLSDRDRDLLYFKYTMDMTCQEIAKLIGVKPDSVKVLIKRARDRAFILLKDEEEFRRVKSFPAE